MPRKCARPDEPGTMPECLQSPDGTWDVLYPDPVSTGVGGGFAALFVLALLGGVPFTVWKVATARRMAREAGMSESDATAMTLLADESFEATFMASNVRTGMPAPQPSAPVARESTESRLAELQSLRDRGLVTEEEYAEARRKILEDL